MRGLNYMKKVLILFGTAIAISMVSISNLHAQQQSSTSNYLYNIMVNTYGTLQAINKLPTYFNDFGQFIKSWMKPDDSKSTTQIQGSFASLGNAFVQDATTQNNGQLQLMIDLINQSSATTPQAGQTTNTAINQILTQVPNLNEISYSTLLGMPPAPKAMTKVAPYNYIKNAAGVTLFHVIPGLKWQGAQNDQSKYQNYFNTVMSIESYGGYILSNQLADSQNGNAITSLQATLISQASSSSWIAQIATQELGKVLRQILMYESQSYVLLSDLVQTQRQALAAQVMTNALIILSNQNGESLLVSKAQGVKPQS